MAKQIPINNNLSLQSPYVYCQAAGSNGNDNTERGIHLRWDFLHELGNQHIAKGDEFFKRYGVESWFNRAKDFVSIYRANVAEIEQAIELPSLSNYTVLAGNTGLVFNVESGDAMQLIVRFNDTVQFTKILKQQPENLSGFLKEYTGVVELEISNELMYSYKLGFYSNQTLEFCFETVCAPHRFERNADRVMKREFKTVNGNGTARATADNIRYVRFNNSPALNIYVFTYARYKVAFNYYQDNQQWQHVGNFSLTLDDTEAFTRFQGSAWGGGDLQLMWPKFNEGVMVREENYVDRWKAEDGLQALVNQFIDESEKNTRAEIKANNEGEAENNIVISLLDMLRIAALDYHAARMLGLGWIDKPEGGDRYVYAAVYTTFPTLPYVGSSVDHVFMTLPTRREDFRLPMPPVLQDVSYGLKVDTDGSGNYQWLSDEQGYSLHEDARFIGLNKKNRHAPEPVSKLFPGKEPLDATNITQPSVFGIEYRGDWEGSWRTPELLHDDLYRDDNGIAETSFTPENDSNPLYVHREVEAGVHCYALYSINWFNRVSEPSDARFTDYTDFPKRNRLLPPSNVGVQYIQEEDPLIFTTQQEQDVLAAANAANQAADNNKTRVVFEWNEVQNMAYQSADRVAFYFRQDALKKVEGVIESVWSLSEKQCVVSTDKFTMYSVNPAVTIMPEIDAGEVDRFIGSYLCTADGQFRIAGFNSTGQAPEILLEKVSSLQAVQGDPNDPFTTMPVYLQPKAKDVFFIYENANNENAWQPLSKMVDLIQFSNTTEILYEEDGSSREVVVGGIYETANVEQIFQNIDGIDVPTEGYRITFDSYQLNDHHDNSVQWMKGSARLQLNGTMVKRSLPVVTIENRNPLRIVVFDPEYYTSSNSIATGTGIYVNYHPGYKVYLEAEPNVFGQPQIMPTGTAITKKTFLSLRSIDSSYGYFSAFTQPATMVARNIQKPQQPQAPLGPQFATRPDVYGKSTYTIDVPLNANGRMPYGLAVYKATEMTILQTLYKPSTIEVILADLAAIEATDTYRFQRWLDLAEVKTETGGVFQFVIKGGYRFPNPDNTGTEAFVKVSGNDFIETASTTVPYLPFPLDPSKSKQFQEDITKYVLEQAFVSLTQTPILFDYLKEGKQTSGMKPKVHDVLGRLLNPTDPLFDPFPMAVRLPVADPNKRIVRVTDYGLSGSAKNIYFYFAKEVSLTTKQSLRSDIKGPVVLVNAYPPEAPQIRRIVSREANPYLGIRAAIEFEVTEYIESEQIAAFEIYRTYDVLDAATIKTMKLAATIPVGSPLEDAFNDLQFPPFGQPVYYRIIALRKIKNERGQVEYIPSKPSEMMMTNIMDVLNPPAPVLTSQKTVDPVTGDLQHVRLYWNATAFNGTYYVYKMNSKGNWQKLHTVKSNKYQLDFPEGGNFNNYPNMALLRKTDDEGNTIYHRFKVSVENASGLFNLEEKELVI
jgi:hypothetical protein